MSNKLVGQVFGIVGMYGGFGLICYGAWRLSHTLGIFVIGFLLLSLGYQAYQQVESSNEQRIVSPPGSNAEGVRREV